VENSHRQTGDLISLLTFLESRLKRCMMKITEEEWKLKNSKNKLKERFHIICVQST
jgi:hypothetical protein